ncbi:MAG: Multicopper oxidase, partial [Thermomicrobiales bacterium]|nr:Multicopper oxidase [Thermomicrobiales bacterium]
MSNHSTASLRHMTGISRRGLLAAGAGAGGTILLTGVGRRSLADADATPPAGHELHDEANGGAGLFQPAQWESAELVEPEVRRSIDGELATELRVHYAYADIGGYRLSLRTYEGA